MTDQLDNGRPVLELYEAINQRDLSTFDRVVSDQVEYTEFGLNETIRGREAFKRYFQKWWKAFPSGSVEIYNLIVSNDQVVIEVLGRGLQSGAFDADGTQIEPANQVLEFHYCKVFRVEDGLITSGRSYSDSYQVLAGAARARKAA